MFCSEISDEIFEQYTQLGKFDLQKLIEEKKISPINENYEICTILDFQYFDYHGQVNS